MATITLTFGDCAENHRGMEKIGKEMEEGFSTEDLRVIIKQWEEKKGKAEVHRLHYALRGVIDGEVEAYRAYLVVLKDGVNVLLGKGGEKKLREEQLALKWDDKAYMYGEVRNKHARHNLCYALDREQEPEYEKKKGRIVDLRKLPYTLRLYEAVCKLANKGELQVEGNYYYDVAKCGIGYHGDGERKIVIGARLGAAFPLHCQWYNGGKPIGENMRIELAGGDMYIMSAKAVGTDWRKKKFPTLRHAAGASKYVQVKE